ncbi:MAG TPA: serine hydrolase domain-containing protein [Candidatus Sulfotelmatobacter sp.]|nr:serine hydrolase domain-containing protein [Candidatus Sulfotelmatobacter sp.]
MFRRRPQQSWRTAVLLLCALVASSSAQSHSPLRSDLREEIDRIVTNSLKATGVPSASLAVVNCSEIAYLHAYGNATLAPQVPARPEMRYSIGSISKQFTATAILMLAEENKLSLNDPISRFLPTLTRADEVRVRDLLAHTSGYQDYWPQDYVPPFMRVEVSAQDILDRWARKPLDFDPGTKWQYSNTNFVIAGLIVERASGKPLMQFLHDRIFQRLEMSSVADIDRGVLKEPDATGYLRYGLGPYHVAPKEARGWLFAAGELAMSAQDLAKWDLAMLRQSLLKPASYQEMQTETLLKNGLGTRYGLGIGITSFLGHRTLQHGGAVSGFTSENMILPDDGIAVVVLTNDMPAEAASQIVHGVASLLLTDTQEMRSQRDKARTILVNLQSGVINRSLFTANANDYFTEQAVRDFEAGLKPLGSPQQFVQTTKEERGGMIFYAYRAEFSSRTLDVWVRVMPDGKIEQYQITVER